MNRLTKMDEEARRRGGEREEQPTGTERPAPLLAAPSSQPAASGAPAPGSYWPRARPHGASYNAMHARLPNGVRPHDWVEAPTMQPPASLPRGNRTVAAFLHYPRQTPYNSYGTPTGGGTDETVCMMTRAVNKAMPTGVKIPFLAMWDYLDDLDGPRDLKVGGVDYSFRRNFWNKLTEKQKIEWRESKVLKLASVMVDEIMERDRVGMDAIVAGACPLQFWPKLLEDAAEIARRETGRQYNIAFPPDLPPLQHPSNAAPGRFMSLCHRKRLDVALSWAHRVKLNGAEINYFQSLSSKYGNKSEAEIKELRRDASARYGGYHGPWPSESELTTQQWAAEYPEEWAALNEAVSMAWREKSARYGGYHGPWPSESELTTQQWAAQYPEQWAALNAAVSTAQSLQSRGGKELVEKAEAGDEAAQAEIKKIKELRRENLTTQQWAAPEKQRARGQAGRGAGCGKGGNSTRTLTDDDLQQMEEEGVQIGTCSGEGCCKRGVVGRIHNKGPGPGKARVYCGRYK